MNRFMVVQPLDCVMDNGSCSMAGKPNYFLDKHKGFEYDCLLLVILNEIEIGTRMAVSDLEMRGTGWSWQGAVPGAKAIPFFVFFMI